MVKSPNIDEIPGLPDALGELEATVNEVQHKLLYRPNGSHGSEVAHYTSLHTLKALACNGDRFRLYSTAYMNDPEEGRAFFKLMDSEAVKQGHAINLEKAFYGNAPASSRRSLAYVGSFVEVDSTGEEKDKLFLWRTYGKHDDREASGACLIFEATQFARTLSPAIDFAPVAQESEGVALQPSLPELGSVAYLDDKFEDVREFNPLPGLYRVVYQGDLEKEGMLNALRGLVPPLEKIGALCNSNAISDSQKSIAVGTVRQMLNSIRFLFKADHYKEEREVRLIRMPYQESGRERQERKVDVAGMPPRFYWEIRKKIRFDEVILGPKAGRVPEWQQWLEEREIANCRKSEIRYGNPG